jgi:hypothetical protein
MTEDGFNWTGNSYYNTGELSATSMASKVTVGRLAFRSDSSLGIHQLLVRWALVDPLRNRRYST